MCTPPVVNSTRKHIRIAMHRSKEREGAASPGPVFMSPGQMSMRNSIEVSQLLLLTIARQRTFCKTFATTDQLAPQDQDLHPHTSTHGLAELLPNL